MIGYVIELDHEGDEEIVLPDGEMNWPLPKNYRQREVGIAVENIAAGLDRRDLAISRSVLHEAVQKSRAVANPPWGKGPKSIPDYRARDAWDAFFSAKRKS